MQAAARPGSRTGATDASVGDLARRVSVVKPNELEAEVLTGVLSRIGSAEEAAAVPPPRRQHRDDHSRRPWRHARPDAWRNIQFSQRRRWIRPRPVMPSRAHLVQAWLAAPRSRTRCDAGLPLGRWPSQLEEPAQACRRRPQSMASSPPALISCRHRRSAWKVSGRGGRRTVVWRGLDGDRLFLALRLDRRRGDPWLAPSPRPPPR